MRKITRTALTTVTAATAVVALTAAPALAGPPWTVTGNTNADGHYNGTSGTVTFKDVTKNLTLTCTSATATGQLANGSYSTATVGSVTGSTWTGCKGPGGISLSVAQNSAWTVNATSGPDASGNVSGNIGSVSAHVTGPGCSFTVTGTAPGHYHNTGTLTLDPASSLTISSASCLGIITNGDVASIGATYAISPSTINIS
jgi:hypothetical protein